MLQRPKLDAHVELNRGGGCSSSRFQAMGSTGESHLPGVNAAKCGPCEDALIGQIHAALLWYQS